VRIAVLCSRYPAVSHTFIQREVRALRGLGADVSTFAVRRASPADALSPADREELAATHAILPAGPGLVRAHLHALVRHPRAWAGTLLRALRLSPGTPRGTLWQVFYFAEAVSLWDELRRRGIRHVHAHFANVSSDVALLATDLGNRADGAGWSWSLAIHGPAQLRENRLDVKAEDASFVACVSDHLRSELMLVTPPEQWPSLHLVRTGVDPEVFQPSEEPRLHARVLTVARLIRGKGIDVLLDAIALLRRRGVAAEADIVGDGPERERLLERIRELGLEPRVRLLGAASQERVRDLLRGATVFCLPSFSEGVPVVVMEAMASGVPVVATRITGVPELVEDGRSGVLVPPGRADLLADALERVLSAPATERDEMGAAGRARVEAEFTPARGARRLMELLGYAT
jgi:colanic acid/amylovoran biosynthesis glycosyltransferase